MPMYARVPVVALSLLGIACGPKPETTPPTDPAVVAVADEAAPATPATAGVLDGVQGEWVGPNTLWFQGPDKPELSDGTMTVTGERIEYTWEFRGAAQKGEMRIESTDDGVQVTWTDTWHSTKPMVSTGAVNDGVLNVLGSYPAGDGPDWGWRTELELGKPDALTMRMFNITPDGQEEIAVLLPGQRPDAAAD